MSTARDFLAAVQQRADDADKAADFHHRREVGNGGRGGGAHLIDASLADVPRLVAALTAVLDIADEMDKNPQTRLDVSTAAMLRAVITDALTPKENDS